MTEVTFRMHSPIKLFLIPGFIMLVLWLFAPIDFVFSGGDGTLLYSVFIVALFAGGLFFGSRRWRSTSVSLELCRNRVRNFVFLLASCGFVGLLLRVSERVFLRAGGEVGSDFMANRELMESGGNPALAFAGGFLSSLLILLPGMVMLLRKAEGKRLRYVLLGLLSLLYPLFDLILQGSRSTLVIYFGIAFLSYISLNAIRMNFRTLCMFFLLLILVPLVIWLMGQVFALRAMQMGIDPIESMTTSGYAYFAPASEKVTQYLYLSRIDGVNGFIYAFTHASQYLLHGMYEFFFVVANLDDRGTYGLQTFYIPVKIISSFFFEGGVEQRIGEGMLRPGVYTTLWGPMIYDFGFWGALLASFLFGYGAGGVSRKLSHGGVEYFPLYIVVFGFVIFAFVVNLFVSGTGQYMLYSATFLFFVLRIHYFSFINYASARE